MCRSNSDFLSSSQFIFLNSMFKSIFSFSFHHSSPKISLRKHFVLLKPFTGVFWCTKSTVECLPLKPNCRQRNSLFVIIGSRHFRSTFLNITIDKRKIENESYIFMYISTGSLTVTIFVTFFSILVHRLFLTLLNMFFNQFTNHFEIPDV